MSRIPFTINSLGYSDILMVGGIVAVAVYLWKSSKSKTNTTMVDLKKLKVLPSK